MQDYIQKLHTAADYIREHVGEAEIGVILGFRTATPDPVQTFTHPFREGDAAQPSFDQRLDPTEQRGAQQHDNAEPHNREHGEYDQRGNRRI